MNSSTAGNRFDSDAFSVLYFGSDLEACFGEVLARFRPDLKLLAQHDSIRQEWADLGFMTVGAVPAEWRQRRLAVQVRLPSDLPYLDVDDPGTLSFLRTELALGLSALGLSDLDSSIIRGSDRRVTRLISQWAWSQVELANPRFAGLRYGSRLGGKWECWAVFMDDLDLEVIDASPIERTMPELQNVASKFSLTVH